MKKYLWMQPLVLISSDKIITSKNLAFQFKMLHFCNIFVLTFLWQF